jgi:hypothetical protein
VKPFEAVVELLNVDFVVGDAKRKSHAEICVGTFPTASAKV